MKPLVIVLWLAWPAPLDPATGDHDGGRMEIVPVRVFLDNGACDAYQKSLKQPAFTLPGSFHFCAVFEPQEFRPTEIEER